MAEQVEAPLVYGGHRGTYEMEGRSQNTCPGLRDRKTEVHDFPPEI